MQYIYKQFLLKILPVIVTVLMLSACGNEQAAPTSSAIQSADITAANLIRQNENFLPDSLLVSWASTTPDTVVNIYLAVQPDSDKKQLLATGITGNSYLISHDNLQRPYVYVEPVNGKGIWVAERVLSLQGGVNFRDMGGYPTRDGRYTKWGMLFRSGTMTDLTSADYQYLSALNIRTMCDLRSREEIEQEPTPWQQFAPDADYLFRDYSMQQIMANNSGEGLRFDTLRTEDQALEMFKGFYRIGPQMYKQQFTEIFRELSAGKGALSFNCSAGKDRTGMAAALILTALDVPRDIIVNDYALSEKVYDFAAREHRKRIKEPHQDKRQDYGMSSIPAEVIKVIMGTNPALIKAMFEQLDQQYGSTLNFIQHELNVTDQQLLQIRQYYLTAAL